MDKLHRMCLVTHIDRPPDNAEEQHSQSAEVRSIGHAGKTAHVGNGASEMFFSNSFASFGNTEAIFSCLMGSTQADSVRQQCKQHWARNDDTWLETQSCCCNHNSTESRLSRHSRRVSIAKGTLQSAFGDAVALDGGSSSSIKHDRAGAS